MVGGALAQKAARTVDQSSSIELLIGDRFVGRAGFKLAAALDHFGVSPLGYIVLDVGAAVGGFTDCLLQRGAKSIVALDVGTGQLAPELRNHPAVRPLEGLDIREADIEAIGGPFDLVVADLSFISLCAVAGALASAARPGGPVISLIKPQFEVGRDDVGRGVVSDQARREHAVGRVRDCFRAAGLDTVDVMPSPVLGEHGNQEYLLFARRRVGEIGHVK